MVTGAWATESEAQSEAHGALPPVPVEELVSKRSGVSFDAGILGAVCGVGAGQAWQRTQFCLGAVADLLFGRKTERSMGAGLYAQVATAGFNDGRFSLGAAGLLPVGEWLILEGRLAPLIKVGGGGTQAGLEGYLEFGQRSYSLRTHYSLSHTLLTGLQWTAPTDALPGGTAIFLGVRVDAYWLTTPALLFQ